MAKTTETEAQMLPTKLWLEFVARLCTCVMGVVSVCVIPWAYSINNNVTTNSVELRRVVDGFETFTAALEVQEKLIYQTREDLLRAVPNSSKVDALHGQLNILSVANERLERRVDQLEKAP